MKTTLIAIALLLGGALAGCQATANLNVGKAKAAVEVTMKAYAASLAQGPTATAAFYPPDGELIEGTTSHRGPREVQAYLQPIFDKVDIADARMDSESVEIYGNIAYQWGTYSQRAALKGQPLKEYKGRFVAKWRMEPDGHWRMLRLMTNP